ncbi:MAG: hypothetical protein C4327_04390 [Meiothermus sp.]
MHPWHLFEAEAKAKVERLRADARQQRLLAPVSVPILAWALVAMARRLEVRPMSLKRGEG